MKTRSALFAFFAVFILSACNTGENEGPFLATGIKIGEVTQETAIVWVRLTERAERVDNEAPLPLVKYRDPETAELLESGKGRPNLKPEVFFPEGYDISSIQGAVPGSKGEARIMYRKMNETEWINTDWKEMDPEKDFTHQFELADLEAGKEYELWVECRPVGARSYTASIQGSFKTAASPDAEADINFIVTTGTSYPDVDSEAGYKFYLSALELEPEFFVHTGDIVYYDNLGKTEGLARWHWDRMYSYPNNIEFHRQVPSYFIKDDHDTWMNDCWPGMQTQFMGEFTYGQGTQIFLDQVPMGDKTYRTIRWGKDLQIWLVEGRDYRSPNPMPDGPDKTIWGEEQMEWFKSTVQASDATFRVLISPTPVVGPDRTKKNDNHSNKGFTHEGALLREFMAGMGNMVSVCGDRHWQYVSKDKNTGLMEFSCGPGSHAHAGGWSNDQRHPEHLYLNVVGGFLEGSVEQREGKPVLVFSHYSPDGELYNEYVFE